MITVQLKVKHFYFIVNAIKEMPISDYFNMIVKIKMSCYGVDDEDIVGVLVDPSNVISIFRLLSSMPEGVANRTNSEMIDLLLPQIQNGIDSNIDEWISLANEINLIRQNNWDLADNYILAGKYFINNQ